MANGISLFTNGMTRTSNERTIKENMIFDSVNGSVFLHEDGSTIWRPMKGNEQLLVFDLTQLDPNTGIAVDTPGTVYTPIGGCAFSDCFIIYTVNAADDSIIWLFQLNQKNQAFGQVLLSDLSYPTGKLTQKRWNNQRIRALFENYQLYRIKWCDGVESDSNPPRSISFKRTTTVTDPTYNGNTITGTFNLFEVLPLATPIMSNLMAPFKMGLIHFVKRVDGQILSGRYIYLYRLIMADGYRTPFCHPSNPVFATTDPVVTNMHKYEMEASYLNTSIGHRIGIWGVDQAYETLEASYVFIPDSTNVPTEARSFAFVKITAEYMEVDHVSNSGEVLSVDEMISLKLNIRGAQTTEIKHDHLWYGNYKTEQNVLTEAEINGMLENVKAIHIFRDMPIDKQGKTDKTYYGHGVVGQLFNLPVSIETTTFNVNDVQKIVYPIESDYTGYRGQQVDHTYVGYPRDEVVRFGVQVYDLEGNPGFVYHICDYKFPKMFNGDAIGDVTAERIRPDETIQDVLDTVSLALHKKAWLTTGQGDTEALSDVANYPSILESPVVDGEDARTDNLPYGSAGGGDQMIETFARIMGIKFDGIDITNLTDRIGGFAIVRCKIEHSTVAQGLISPTVHAETITDIKVMPRPNMGITWWGLPPFNGLSPSVSDPYLAAPERYADRDYDTIDSVSNRIGFDEEFGTMYIPEVMFSREFLPSYDANQYMELVQICWEEYNYGGEIIDMRSEGGASAYGRTQGPLLCNSFLTDPRDLSGPTQEMWRHSTKLSWHLMVNTRLQDHYPSGSGISMPYRHDVPFPAYGGSPLITGHTYDTEYANEWADPKIMFPIYGDRFQPDWIKLEDSNARDTPISPSRPSFQFVNATWYWIWETAGFPNTFNTRDYYYGKFSDYELHDMPGTILAPTPVTTDWDYTRCGIGHQNTLLFRFTGFQPGYGDASYFMCAVMPTWAEVQLAGASLTWKYWHHPRIGATARWIFNWKRTLSGLYGGQTTVALSTNLFISTGHFQPVGNPHFDTAVSNPTGNILNDVEVWGGECWLDLHSGALLYPNIAHDDEFGMPDGTGVQLPEQSDCGFVFVFPHESKMNLALRNAPSPTDPKSPTAGLRSRVVYDGWDHSYSEWNKGLFFYGGKYGNTPDAAKHLFEEFYINNVLMYSDMYRAYITVPRGFNSINHWPQRWTYSEVKVYGSLVDSFRSFLVNNIRDLEGSYGAIMASAIFLDKFYSWQELAFGILRVYERSIVPTSNGQIVTGDAGVIEGIRYLNEQVGCQHPESVVITTKTIYWIDAFNMTVNVLDGERSLDLGMEKGMGTLLRELLYRYVDGRSIYGPHGMTIVGGYDGEKHQVQFSLTSKLSDLVTYPFQAPLAKRYRQELVSAVFATINAITHFHAIIRFVDSGSQVAPIASSGLNLIHVAEQDVIILRGTTYSNAHSFLFELYSGGYNSASSQMRMLTVREFYIIIPGEAYTGASQPVNWFAEFRTVQEGNPTITVPDISYPLATATTEKEGYLYHSAGYPTNVPAPTIPVVSKAQDAESAVFHLYRTESDGMFQVRMIKGMGSLDGIAHGLIRSKLVYNEGAEVFETWRGVGDIFAMPVRSLLLTAMESEVGAGLWIEAFRSKERPSVYGMVFQSFLMYIFNEIVGANKIFDNSRFHVSDISDIESVRYTTEEQAIYIKMSTDTRAAYKRRINRLPIRRELQLDRVRGTYLNICIEMNHERHKLAFVYSSLTLYRISNKN